MKVSFNVRISGLEERAFIQEFASDVAAGQFISEFRTVGKYFTKGDGKQLYVPPSSFLSAEEL